MKTTLDTSCSENTMVWVLHTLPCRKYLMAYVFSDYSGTVKCKISNAGFVSKARVSACMYFLVNMSKFGAPSYN